nr:hypothetical protein [Tanacetum cinerariifolium]
MSNVDCLPTTVDWWSSGGQWWSSGSQRLSATGDRRLLPPLIANHHRDPLPLTGGSPPLTSGRRRGGWTNWKMTRHHGTVAAVEGSVQGQYE